MSQLKLDATQQKRLARQAKEAAAEAAREEWLLHAVQWLADGSAKTPTGASIRTWQAQNNMVRLEHLRPFPAPDTPPASDPGCSTLTRPPSKGWVSPCTSIA